LLRQNGDLDAAIEVFTKAVSINPHYLKALIKLGIALREKGDTRQAADVFKRALAVDPSAVDLHYQLGLIFADRAQFADALERFEYATKHSPHHVEYIANLALSLQDMGLLDRATAAWQTLAEAARHSCQGQSLLDEASHSALPRVRDG